MSNLVRKIFHKLHIVRRLELQSCWDNYKDYLNIHSSVIISPSASISIVNPPISPEICLEIGEGSHIFSSFSLLRPHAKIKVGKRCQLGNSLFACTRSIEVGDDVIMAWGITIIDSDNHSEYWSDRQYDVERCRRDYIQTNGADIARSHDWEKVKSEDVKIGNKCWIGFNVSILKGVTVGEGAIIGAGSVVTSDVKPWHIGAGNPFRHIRPIAENRNE
jgi:acetyltransferase-like isoleucine patch superfamily enzyme